MTTRNALSCAFAALVLVAGCGRQNRGSVQLSSLCFSPAPDSNGNCIFSSGGCNTVLLEGSLEVDLPNNGFTLEYPIQIDNLLPDNTDLSVGRTNANNATIDRFDLEYVGLNLTASAAQTVVVLANSSTVAQVQLIPPAAGAQLANAVGGGGALNIAVRVRAHGRFGDDTEFDTASDYTVPVTLKSLGPYTCPTGKTLQCCPACYQTATRLCN